MAPVKEYVAGLEKRLPGKHYENVLLVDTLGNYHELKEYMGKGYVVLHFWENWHRNQIVLETLNPNRVIRLIWVKGAAPSGRQPISLSSSS